MYGLAVPISKREICRQSIYIYSTLYASVPLHGMDWITLSNVAIVYRLLNTCIQITGVEINAIKCCNRILFFFKTNCSPRLFEYTGCQGGILIKLLAIGLLSINMLH